MEKKEPPNLRHGDVNEYGNITKTCKICWHLRYFPGRPDKNICIEYLKLGVGLFDVCDSWKSFRNMFRDNTLNAAEIAAIKGHYSPEALEGI